MVTYITNTFCKNELNIATPYPTTKSVFFFLIVPISLCFVDCESYYSLCK